MEFRGIILFSCFLLVACAESVWSPAASHSYSQSSGHCLFPQRGLVHKYSVGVHGAAAYAVPALMGVDHIMFRNPRLCSMPPIIVGVPISCMNPFLARGRLGPTGRECCPIFSGSFLHAKCTISARKCHSLIHVILLS